jgi:hypothetical protein
MRVLSSALLIAAAAVLAAGGTVTEVPSKERHLVLRSTSGESLAEIIEVSSFEDEGDLTLWKVLTPEKNRALWSSGHEAETTRFAGRLEDLESGWHAELAISSGTESPRFSTQGAHGLMADLREQEALLTMTLETSDGFTAEHQSPIDAPRSDDSDWKKLFASDLAEHEVGRDIPESAREEIRFLMRVGGQLGAENTFAQSLVELMHQELERVRLHDQQAEDGLYSDSEWELGHGTVEIGGATDPRATHRELARRFEEETGEDTPDPPAKSPPNK